MKQEPVPVVPHIIAVVWGSFVTLVCYIIVCMFMPSLLLETAAPEFDTNVNL